MDGAGPLGVALRVRILPHCLLNISHLREMERKGGPFTGTVLLVSQSELVLIEGLDFVFKSCVCLQCIQCNITLGAAKINAFLKVNSEPSIFRTLNSKDEV